MGINLAPGNNGLAKSIGLAWEGYYNRQINNFLDIRFCHGVVHSSQYNQDVENLNYKDVTRYIFQKTNIAVYYVPFRKPKHELKVGLGPELAYVFRLKGPGVFVKDNSIAGGWITSLMYEAHPTDKITAGLFLNWEPLFGKEKNGGIGNFFPGFMLGGRF